MKESVLSDYIQQLLLKGVSNIVSNSVEESLICASLDALFLGNCEPKWYRNERKRQIWIETIQQYVVQFEDIRKCTQNRYQALEISTPPNFYKSLKNKGFCGDYHYLDKKFENPYPEETLRYAMFQGSPAEWLTGMHKIEDLELRCTPTLPFTALIAQMEIIQRELFDTNKVLYNFRDILKSLPIFLVTTKLEGKDHEVVNPFDGTKVITKIPKSFDVEECGSDALGMYVPTNGCIYLWVDKIYSYRIHSLIFQKVLLHELIHFFFDVVRRSSVKSNKNRNENEETMDNFLVLHMYSNAITPIKDGLDKNSFTDIKDFISKQPYNYRAACEEFENASDWFSAREKIFEFLK